MNSENQFEQAIRACIEEHGVLAPDVFVDIFQRLGVSAALQNNLVFLGIESEQDGFINSARPLNVRRIGNTIEAPAAIAVPSNNLAWYKRIRRHRQRNMDVILTERVTTVAGVNEQVDARAVVRDTVLANTIEEVLTLVNGTLKRIVLDVNAFKVLQRIFCWYNHLIFVKLVNSNVANADAINIMVRNGVEELNFTKNIRDGSYVNILIQQFGLPAILCLELFPSETFDYPLTRFESYVNFVQQSQFFQELNINTENIDYLIQNIPNFLNRMNIHDEINDF